MRPRFLLVATLMLILGGLLAPGALADSGAATYDYHVGDAFLAALNPAFAPDVARAANGDTIAIAGTGTFTLAPKSATGSGTFVHKSAAGDVRGMGAWTATELLRFHSFGGSAAVPANWRAGQALLRIHLTPATGGAGFDGLLAVTCHLPGQEGLPGEEGIKLNVQEVINFTETVSGNTLFVLK
jgi:hypothetical protein